MREILIDWLIDVHMKFKLKEDTLFIAINIIDRYLEIKTVKSCMMETKIASSIMSSTFTCLGC